jgi:Lysozyme like domain
VTTYTYAQLEQLWINNGGTAATAPVAAAIAEAESSGNAAVTSSNPDGGTNVGLWQLDTPGGGGAGYTVSQLQDPNTNAAVAVAVSKSGSNWSTWATYASGAYKQFVSNGTTPDSNVPASTGTTATGSTTAALSSASASACLVQFPSVNLVVTSVGGGCLVTKSEARAVIGGVLLAAGGIMGLVSVLIIAASAFEHTGAGSALTKAAGVVALA